MTIDYEALVTAPLPGGEASLEPIGGYYGGGSQGGPGGVPYREGMAPAPAYVAGDEFTELKALTTEDRVRLQQQLKAVGLVSSFVPGELDDRTIQGFAHLLSISNRQAEDWQATLTRIATNPALADGGPEEFEPDPYLPPDYASLAQEVKETWRKRLGRDPDEGEMAQMTAELTGWHRDAYEVGVAAQESAFEAGQQPGQQGGGTFQRVDPSSRFQELFEQKYRHELDFVEDKGDAKKTQAVIDSGVGTLSAMSRSN